MQQHITSSNSSSLGPCTCWRCRNWQRTTIMLTNIWDQCMWSLFHIRAPIATISFCQISFLIRYVVVPERKRHECWCPETDPASRGSSPRSEQYDIPKIIDVSTPSEETPGIAPPFVLWVSFPDLSLVLGICIEERTQQIHCYQDDALMGGQVIVDS